MAVIAPLIAQMVIDGLVNRPAQQPVALRKTDVAFGLLSVFLMCAGAIFLLIAFYQYALISQGAVIAALLTGGAAVLASALIGIGLSIKKAARKSRQKHMASAAASQADRLKDELIAALSAATEGLEDPIARNPRTSVLLASLAGYAAANKMH